MRIWIRMLLACVAMVWTMSSAIAGTAHGVIPERVTVRGAEIRLLEVARVSDVPPAVQAQLEAARLGPAPRPGESITLPRATVLTRLRSSAAASASVDWQVAERVTIVRASVPLQQPQIEEALRQFVQRNQALPLERLSIDAVQVRTPIQVPVGELELDFELPSGDDLLGPTSLTLVARVDGAQAARVPVRARIDGDVRVFVTAHALRKGARIGEGDIREEVRPISRAGAHPAINRAEVRGKIAKRAISPNQVLGLEDLELPPAVRRGDPVLLVVRTERLVVTCPGEALQDGRVGELVPVVNPSTRKEMRGRLNEAGEVEIDYRGPRSLQTRN